MKLLYKFPMSTSLEKVDHHVYMFAIPVTKHLMVHPAFRGVDDKPIQPAHMTLRWWGVSVRWGMYRTLGYWRGMIPAIAFAVFVERFITDWDELISRYSDVDAIGLYNPEKKTERGEALKKMLTPVEDYNETLEPFMFTRWG